jgi:3-oxoacyl-(acyl-carrier-protein) synthase
MTDVKSDQMVISAFSFVDSEGLGGVNVFGEKLDFAPGSWREVYQQVFAQKPCDHFGRLDPLCRYALTAAEIVGLSGSEDDETLDRMGLVMGTEFGCFSVDADFLKNVRGTGAKPLQFLYTLPNIALGEIAIRHVIRGLNLCVMAGPESGLLALWQGYGLVANGEASGCLCLGADAVASWAAEYFPDETMKARASNGFAYAFLLETDSVAQSNGRRPLAGLTLADPNPDDTELQTASSCRGLSELARYLLDDRDARPGCRIPAPEAMKTGRVLLLN